MKIRPVRLPPCAAGASPSTSTRARRIAEAGQRAAPVLLVGERGALDASDLLAPLRRAAGSGGTTTISLLERVERAHESLGGGRQHAADQPVDHRRELEHVLRLAEADLTRDELGDRADDRERVVWRGEPRDQSAATQPRRSRRRAARRTAAGSGRGAGRRAGPAPMISTSSVWAYSGCSASVVRNARVPARIRCGRIGAPDAPGCLGHRLVRRPRRPCRTARGCSPPCWRSARRRSPSTCRPAG